jgi:hypothetical protein
VAPSDKPKAANGPFARPRTLDERLAAIKAAVDEFQRNITDVRPVTKEEWDEINDDTD